MRKHVLTLVLCIALALPGLAGATNATEFSDITVELDQYTVGEGLNIGLSAYYPDEETARLFHPIIELEDVTPESLREEYLTTAEANADQIPEGTRYLVAFCTDAEGNPLFKDGSYNSLSFNLLTPPHEEPVGSWRAEMQIDADGFDTTGVDTVFVELYIFDPLAEEPLLEKAVSAITFSLTE